MAILNHKHSLAAAVGEMLNPKYTHFCWNKDFFALPWPKNLSRNCVKLHIKLLVTFYNFWLLFQTTVNENGESVTTSRIEFHPKASDHQKEITCRAENTNIRGSAIEDTQKLVVHCKLRNESKMRISRARSMFNIRTRIYPENLLFVKNSLYPHIFHPITFRIYSRIRITFKYLISG